MKDWLQELEALKEQSSHNLTTYGKKRLTWLEQQLTSIYAQKTHFSSEIRDDAYIMYEGD